MQLLNNAKACIPLHWRDTDPPTKALWFDKFNNLQDMEELTATLRNTEELCTETWRPRKYFVYSDAYLNELSDSQ